MSAREQMLSAVRDALRDVPAGEPVAWSPSDPEDDRRAAYRRVEDELDLAARAALFAERCAEYRATVTRCDGDAPAVRAAVADACARHGARVLALAPGLPDDWRPDGLELCADDPPLALAQLDGCDGAITAAAGAIALTGTIVLDGSARCGRRALTLVPDLHVCVVHAEQVHGGVPEAIAALAGPIAERRAPITFVSGPSATSDIELQRVEGVHGPRRLEVVLAG